MNQTNSKILIAILTLVFFYLLNLAINSNDTELDSPPSSSSKNFSLERGGKIANRHLFLTNEKMKVEEEKMKLHAEAMIQQGNISKKIESPSLQSKRDDDWGPAPTSKDNSQIEPVFETPDEVIQRQLYEKQLDEAYDESYREAYAKEFVENARRHGYEIKLNSDNQVISVKKIK